MICQLIDILINNLIVSAIIQIESSDHKAFQAVLPYEYVENNLIERFKLQLQVMLLIDYTMIKIYCLRHTNLALSALTVKSGRARILQMCRLLKLD